LLRGPNGLIATYAITVTGTVDAHPIGIPAPTQPSSRYRPAGLRHFCAGSAELLARAETLRSQLTVEPHPAPRTTASAIAADRNLRGIVDGTPIRPAPRKAATIELIDAIYHRRRPTPLIALLPRRDDAIGSPGR